MSARKSKKKQKTALILMEEEIVVENSPFSFLVSVTVCMRRREKEKYLRKL